MPCRFARRRRRPPKGPNPARRMVRLQNSVAGWSKRFDISASPFVMPDTVARRPSRPSLRLWRPVRVRPTCLSLTRRRHRLHGKPQRLPRQSLHPPVHPLRPPVVAHPLLDPPTIRTACRLKSRRPRLLLRSLNRESVNFASGWFASTQPLTFSSTSLPASGSPAWPTFRHWRSYRTTNSNTSCRSTLGVPGSQS